MLKPRKWWLIFLGIIVIAVVSVWFFEQRNNSELLASHKFVGQVTSVSGNTIQVTGTHILDTNPNASDYKHPQILTVQIQTTTKIIKMDLQNTKTGQTKTLQAGLITDIKNNDSVEIKTANNSLKDKVLTASQITDYDVSVK